jgi:hypothetical protein
MNFEKINLGARICGDDRKWTVFLCEILDENS